MKRRVRVAAAVLCAAMWVEATSAGGATACVLPQTMRYPTTNGGNMTSANASGQSQSAACGSATPKFASSLFL